MNTLIFPKTGHISSENSESGTPEAPNCLVKSIIKNFLSTKRSNTIISLSIMGVKPNGALTDELDYEWLEETENIENAIKEKIPLKITK